MTRKPPTPQPDQWRQFFDHPEYFRFSHAILPPERTEREVAAMVALLGLDAGSKVLDLGCGYGRISVPLARMGCEVTGWDASGPLLERARKAAADAGVEITFVHADMQELDAIETFDAVVSISTALGYVPDEDADRRALQAVGRAMVPGGGLLIDTENRDQKIRGTGRTWYELAGTVVWCDRSFDPRTGRWQELIEWLAPTGRDSARYSLRLYSLTELASLLTAAGLTVTGAWGDLANAPYRLESPRTVVLAERPHREPGR